MVKLLLKTPNILEVTEYNTIKLDPANPTTLEVVEPEGETKKVWKVKGQQYSKKTGSLKQTGTGQGQHWQHAFKLSTVEEIIDESSTYYRTAQASNFLYRKDTLKLEVCKSCNSNDIKQFMDTLNGTK